MNKFDSNVMLKNIKSFTPLNMKRSNNSYLFSFIATHLIHYPTPITLTYAWSFGFLAGMCLVSQMISGIFLAMHYTPHVDLAFSSVEYIMRDVPNGWLLRYIHANGASMFFIVVYSHIFRGLYYGSYMKPRELLWCSGVLLFVLMMATAFTGYVLPWGQMSFWGATVITSMFTVIPIAGKAIVEWLWGGFTVNNPTLNRFFSIHFILPFLIAGVTLIHLALLHKDGSNNPIGSDAGVAINTFITMGSFVITPPESMGKISMLSWFASQHEESLAIIFCFLAEVFLLVIALLGFFFIYIVYKKDRFFVDEFLPHFKKVSPIRKFLLGSFTVFTAIPNKFWINVEIHFLFVCVISAIIYFLGLIFPFIFFCYLMYIVLCLESILFGLLYEYSKYFRELVNFSLFGRPDEPFAVKYFHWFWGNMWSRGSKKLAPIVTTAAAVEAKRQAENKARTAYANQRTDSAGVNTKEGFKTPNEMAEYHQARVDEFTDKNGLVTKAIKVVNEFFEKS